MEIQQVETGKLIPYANNARVHSKEQIGQIAASIKEFGFNNPILCDGEKGIIAGHGRLIAAQKLELDTVPVIELEHLSDAQKRAYILADNKIAENATWDMDLVNMELEGLYDELDISLTGFDLDIEAPGGGDYTQKIKSPVYEPTGEKPDIKDLYDNKKMLELVSEVDKAGLPEDEKEYLKAAATRHIVFNYRNAAEYYAHCGPEMQSFMERSGLVIVDFDQAIENGFVRMSESIIKQYLEEHEGVESD